MRGKKNRRRKKGKKGIPLKNNSMCDLTFINQSIFFDVKEEEKNLKHYDIYKTQQKSS